MKPIWRDKKNSPLKINRLLCSLILMVLLYTCESWTHKGGSKLHGWDTSDTSITNEEVYRRMNHQINGYRDVLTVKRKLKWYGHITRLWDFYKEEGDAKENVQCCVDQWPNQVEASCWASCYTTYNPGGLWDKKTLGKSMTLPSYELNKKATLNSKPDVVPREAHTMQLMKGPWSLQ